MKQHGRSRTRNKIQEYTYSTYVVGTCTIPYVRNKGRLANTLLRHQTSVYMYVFEFHLYIV